MKRYVMSRSTGTPVVTVETEEDGEFTVRPLEHLVQHSPDGFEWGYFGSGPADLARSIVGDLIDDRDPAPALYRELRHQLARMPRDGGELDEDQVLELIDEGLL